MHYYEHIWVSVDLFINYKTIFGRLLVTKTTYFFLYIDSSCVFTRGRPIIGADIKHFTDYRYRPFSKQICR